MPTEADLTALSLPMKERLCRCSLTTTLDKLLNRLTNIEEECVFMKEDLKRVKVVLREKLSVSLE